MPLVDALLPEFDHEMTTTRKLLERVPDDRLAWKPHPKSFSLGELATHLTELAMWGSATLQHSEVNIAEGGTRVPAASRAELLATFDKNVAATRAELVGKTDAEFLAPWALKRGDQTIFSMPKAAVWRSFVLNHLIHHRGQLSVYLRIQDVPLPSMYGPSADEQSF
jgi:uncharacterized damage-inducible protein DinB